MTERLPPLPEPLGPEERALAARLARLGPHGEPSPSLDARILAAARDGLPAAAGPARRTARWPWAFGIAASVALAVGLAWQLRPLPERVLYEEAASEVAVVASTPVEETQAGDAVAPAPAAAAPAAATQAPTAFRQRAAQEGEAAAGKTRVADAPADNAAPAPRRAPAQPLPPPVVSQEQSIEEPAAGAAADMALPAPPPPPPPAPQAVKPAAPVAAPLPAPPQAIARESAARRAKAAAESRAAEARAEEAAAQDTFADEPFVEDIPPATADSPSVRDAWLHRIRELQAAGDTESARASLQEFVRRYPAFPLPDDVRPLLGPRDE